MNPKQETGAKERKTLVLPCLENPNDFCRFKYMSNSQHVVDLEVSEGENKTIVVLSVESQKELFEYLKKRLEHVQASEEGGSPKSEPVPQLKTWRCTIWSDHPYGSPGFNDQSARQGYWIEAPTKSDAAMHMLQLFPQHPIEDFDVVEWA